MAETFAARWEVDVGFDPISVVEMDAPSAVWGYPRSFRVDGTKHAFGKSLRLTQIAEFTIRGRRATVTMRLIRPSFRIAFRRAFRQELWDGRTSGALAWAAYELAVDGHSRGSWVATTVAGELQGWTYVEPGGALPTRDTENWGQSAPPAPKPFSSETRATTFVAARHAGRREVASFLAAAVIGAVAFGVAMVTVAGGPGSETGITTDRGLVFGALLAAGVLIGLTTMGGAGYAGAAVGYEGAYLALVAQQVYTLGWSANPQEDVFWFIVLTFLVGIGLAIVLAGAFAGRRLRGVPGLLRRGSGPTRGNTRRA